MSTRYRGAHRHKPDSGRRHRRSNRRLAFTTSFIITGIIFLGVLLAIRHGAAAFFHGSF